MRRRKRGRRRILPGRCSSSIVPSQGVRGSLKRIPLMRKTRIMMMMTTRTLRGWWLASSVSFKLHLELTHHPCRKTFLGSRKRRGKVVPRLGWSLRLTAHVVTPVSLLLTIELSRPCVRLRPPRPSIEPRLLHWGLKLKVMPPRKVGSWLARVRRRCATIVQALRGVRGHE